MPQQHSLWIFCIDDSCTLTKILRSSSLIITLLCISTVLFPLNVVPTGGATISFALKSFFTSQRNCESHWKRKSCWIFFCIFFLQDIFLNFINTEWLVWIYSCDGPLLSFWAITLSLAHPSSNLTITCTHLYTYESSRTDFNIEFVLPYISWLCSTEISPIMTVSVIELEAKLLRTLYDWGTNWQWHVRNKTVREKRKSQKEGRLGEEQLRRQTEPE